MKGTEAFQLAISQYLSGRAALDPLFEKRFGNPDKSIEDCVTFILNQVQSSGANGFTDDEIYSLAVHYYMEDGIDPGKAVSCNVVVNHHVELSEEEINDLKEKARQDVFDKESSRIRSAGRIRPVKVEESAQLSLF